VLLAPEGNLVCVCVWGGGCIPGTLTDEWRGTVVVGHIFARDSMKETFREGSFTGEPERWGFWEICKMPCKRPYLSIAALLGNLKGIRLLGFLGEKKSISGFLSCTRRPLRFQVWGPSVTLVKEQGSPELTLYYGAQRVHLKGLGASGP
jgi:hypothetical protein